LSTFVDTSVWFAAANTRDGHNADAKAILSAVSEPVLTDHVLVETWRLLNSKLHRHAADHFWLGIREGAARLEKVTAGDLEAAWAIGVTFPDQHFSIVDRTSFAVMERLGISQAASFDKHFAIYRYGRGRDKAFDIVRSGHSEAFRLFHRAILDRKQIICSYNGVRRAVSPHILGHTAGEEKALVYQFGGASTSQPFGKAGWRCLFLSKASDITLRDGPWHTGIEHRKTQRCVENLYVDVNTRVPNQPGRR
jgi:predicted nucleic acid-binding protein